MITKTNSIHCFLFAGLLILQSCKLENTHSSGFNPPNIILIMADDLGYEGLSCYGNKVLHTPNIDRMAEGGLRFTDFHSNSSVCTPTRAALLTGSYQQRVGLEGVIYVKGPTRQVGLDTSEITIAKLLKSNGYATGLFGKWHLGYEPEYNPVYHGFDEFYGYVSGNIDYHSHYDNAGIYDWWHNLDSIKEEGYVTDLITDHTIDFIKEHKEVPFFAYVPYESPHVPFQGPDDPAYRFDDNEFTYYGPVEDRDRAYIDMVESMDDGVGKILKTLTDLNLDENTLVLFISDNGAESFGHNGILKGNKISLHEGGHRVPAIAYWKGKIEQGITNELAMTFDWMPTILSLTQIKNIATLQLDGLDLSQLLLTGQALPERNLFWKYLKEKTIRQNEYKLLISESDTMLFNLENDITESDNIIALHPERVKTMSAALEQWEQEMNTVTQKTK
ncbi:MAG: arylsulfatase A [Saprospiraceae bacterium]|jgi:arylsulfatase A